MLQRADANNDGAVERSEVEKVAEEFTIDQKQGDDPTQRGRSDE